MLKIEKKRMAMLLFIMFTFHLCLGFGLSRLNVISENIYFGADNGRIYRDLMLIKTSHYRIKVHPLFLFLLQPLSLLISGIVQDKASTIIFLQSIIGTINAAVIFHILSGLIGLKKVQSVLLCLIYVFSFSNIIFVSIPESFLYAEFFLVLFWLFIFHTTGNSVLSERKTELLLIFFGVTIFGVTLTNYVQFIIGLLAYLFLKGYSNQDKIKKFLKINIFTGVIVILIVKLQQLAWRGDTPVFWSSLKLAAKGSSEFEEFRYMSWDIYWDKTVNYIKDFFGHIFLAGQFAHKKNGNYNPIMFTGFSVLDICFLLLFFVIILICVLYAVRIIFKSRKEKVLFCAVLISYFFNAALHYVYGSWESFIYSPHYLFLLVLLFGMCLSKIDRKKLWTLCTAGLLLFFLYESLTNLMAYRNLVEMVTVYHGIPLYSVKKIFIKTIAMSAAIFMFFGAFYHLCKKSFRVELLNKENVPLLLIFSYMGLCFATTFFIYINYWKI